MSTEQQKQQQPLKRVLRLLEYVGTDEWITTCLDRRMIKGTHQFEKVGVIRECVLGDTAELLRHYIYIDSFLSLLNQEDRATQTEPQDSGYLGMWQLENGWIVEITMNPTTKGWECLDREIKLTWDKNGNNTDNIPQYNLSERIREESPDFMDYSARMNMSGRKVIVR